MYFQTNYRQFENEAELALKYCHNVHIVLHTEISGFKLFY